MTEITYSALYTWADAQPDDQHIGLANDCNACPVAMFLAATTGEAWEVIPLLNSDWLYARAIMTSELVTLSDWLCRAIHALDGNGIGRPPISKSAFLAILAKHIGHVSSVAAHKMWTM
jgi:hypothetical protein